MFRALLLAALFMAAPAQAQQQEMIFREDSGLTKTEYFLATGQYSAALQAAGDVLTRNPNNADAYTYRGYALNHLGQAEDAAKNYRKALQLNPKHLGANKYLADIYLQKGDVARAIEQMQVIRMTCGATDCEELNSLARAIDRFRSTDAVKKDSEKKD